MDTPFDFFNYAGIDHAVVLYSISKYFIQDIAIDTQSIDFDGQYVATSAVLNYTVTVGGAPSTNALRVLIQLLDANGMVVANNTDSQSRLVVSKPNLWQPCGMNHTHPCTEESYLYTLQVTLYNDATPTEVVDVYRIPHVGIRTVRLTDSKFLVNERPFYFHGANAHGNTFRTSHYPYAEEFYHMADRYGVAIIGETPAVGLSPVQFASQAALEHHIQVVA